MGIECMVCHHVEMGIDGLHLIKECRNPNCKNRKKSLFRRVPDKISEKQKENEREWLKSHEKH
jgi:hypothetical protein